jgi:TatD DNase family protein
MAKHMKIEFIDSHAHLDFDQYDMDRPEMLERAKKARVENILQIAMGPSEEKIIQCYSLVKKIPHMRMAVGIHPHDADHFNDDVYHLILTYASKEKVSAIGEIGLDYYYENSNRENQKKCFSQLMDLAIIMNLPISVHTRDAFDDTYALAKEKDVFQKVGGVIHCFTGTDEQALKFIELGAYISFSGVVTFKNTEELQKAVKAVPLSKMLIETDSPFLAPIPYRGKRNEPAYVVETAKTIAAIKGISLEEVAAATTTNARKLFKFS